MDILALLQPVNGCLPKTTFRQMSRVVFALLAMTGRVTMLGLCLVGLEKAAAIVPFNGFIKPPFLGQRNSGSSSHKVFGRKRMFTFWRAMSVW